VLPTRLRSGSGMTGKICGSSIDGVCKAPKRALKKHGCSPQQPGWSPRTQHYLCEQPKAYVRWPGKWPCPVMHPFQPANKCCKSTPGKKLSLNHVTSRQTALKSFNFSTSSRYGSRSYGVLQYFKALLCALQLAAMRACMPTRLEHRCAQPGMLPGCLTSSYTCQFQVLQAKAGNSCKVSSKAPSAGTAKSLP